MWQRRSSANAGARQRASPPQCCRSSSSVCARVQPHLDRRCRRRAAAAQAVARGAAGQQQQQQQHQHQEQQQPQPALLYDFHDQLIPYEQAWAWQRQRVAQLCDAAEQDRRDTVFLLQHPPVYTLGAGSNEAHVGFDLAAPPHPLFRTERGGEVTFHGPGQLVMYPILDLNRHTQDLHWYLRGLEEVVIRALAATSGLQGCRVDGLTGVWVGGAKLAAIGVRARKWITYHGLALNVATDLQPFRHITPCGIADRPVGSVATALGQQPPPQQVPQPQSQQLPPQQQAQQQQAAPSPSQQQQQQQAQQRWLDAARDPLVVEYRYALLEALEEVFGLALQPASQQQLEGLLAQHGGGSASASAADRVGGRSRALAAAG